ncbi:MAG TPA: hypothetical protein V6D18_05105 [Thermosynechococcaceae cyanobacterium]
MKLLSWVKGTLAKGDRSEKEVSPEPQPEPVVPQASVLDAYVKTSPSPQTALDIFQGEWGSALPAPFAHLKAGVWELFNDDRIHWFFKEIGGVEGKSVLELGPLEGGHTYMLEKAGAAEILSVEANTRAFLKCLIVKELLEMRYARFLCGDFLEFLREEELSFQVCLASGVLYHMQNPAELISLLARRCSEYLLLWTHYYDASLILNSPWASKFNGSFEHEYQGFHHTLHRQEYQASLDFAGFCGGNAPTSCWMTRADILRCLDHFGFELLGINFDTPNPNGPCFALVARRRSS